MIVVQDPAGRVLLERRPERGIWGGLYCLPELDDGGGALEWCVRRLGVAPSGKRELAPVAHAFTHFDLVILPTLVRLDTDCGSVMESDNLLWYNAAAREIGIAAPIRTLLASLEAGASEKGSEPFFR